MGYNTHFTGEIAITPPLPWSEIKDSDYLPANQGFDSDRDLKFKVDEQETQADEGTLLRREAVAVIPIEEGAYKGYDIVEHLQEIVDAYPDRTFGGYIRADGEEAGDIWRLAVVDGCATKIRPRIVWPDGTEESPR